MTPKPYEVHCSIRQDSVTLHEISACIPRQFRKPQELRSLWCLVRVALSVAACLYLLSGIQLQSGLSLVWQIPCYITLWLLYGWVLVGLFVIGHECGHGSFSHHRWLNSLVGTLCMAPLANSFWSWKITHDIHHKHTQLRGSEVDWASYLLTSQELRDSKSTVVRLGYILPFGILFWIGWNALLRGAAIRDVVGPQRWQTEKWRLRLSSLLTALMLLAIYMGLWHFTGLSGVLKLHFVPATIAMLTGWIIIAVQHAQPGAILYNRSQWNPARGQLASTFDIRFPAFLEYLWCNINIHIPHHVAPAIPWYRLKEASFILRRNFPELYQQQRLSWGQHIDWMKKTPRLSLVEDGLYTITSDVSQHLA